MSEPENPRWLNGISDELRREVPVRASWRARVLDDLARAPRPTASDTVDVRFDESTLDAPAARRRSIVLSPLTGLAAALLFVVLGAGIMYMTMSRAPREIARTPAQAIDLSGKEAVRFELVAPNASRVTLVGSFNEWNPVATPLVRDQATGKWIVSVRLSPGRHVYAFVVDGDLTADPTAPRAADDDFGSSNSVVFVSSPRT